MGLLVLLHAMYLSDLPDGNLAVTSHPPPTLTRGLQELRRTLSILELPLCPPQNRIDPNTEKSLSFLAWAVATGFQLIVSRE